MSLRIRDRATARGVVGDTITINLRNLLNDDGEKYDLSAATKIYCMVKTTLSDLDAAALINIDSSSNPTQFVLTDAVNGNISVILSPTNSATLTAGTRYFLDVKAVWEDGIIISLVNEPEFSLIGRVTLATT